MTTDTRTPNRNLPVPVAGNTIAADFARLATALGMVDTDLANLITGLAAKAGVADLGNYQALSGKAVANGYASLDSTGKIPTGQLPQAIGGGLVPKGTWNAATNSPAIPAAATANQGWYYIVATSGSTNVSGITDWVAGDWIISDGTVWQKIDNTDKVASVAGKTGAVTLAAADIADASANGRSLITAATYAAMRTLLGLASGATTVVGTAAALNVGVAANNVVQLTAAAKLPAVDGSLLTNLPAAGGFKDVKFITSSGTYTPTAGTTKILVYAQGGGGNGSNGYWSGNQGTGGGGGAGGCAIRAYAVAAQTFTCTVGGAGGTTTFTDGTTSISGNGGAGGAQNGVGGAGGSASGGTANITGQAGGPGQYSTNSSDGGGFGGTGMFAGGGKGGGIGQATAGTNGGGGGGTYNGGSGGSGGAGCIMILEY